MGEFYGKKIKTSEINTKTGDPWTIEDVPKLWRTATARWLRDHA